MEEFNFSKAAIRFSQRLTKDNVSVGLRALTQQLGLVIGQSRPVALEFSFGKLISEEREVRFSFAADLYTANGLEIPASGCGADEDGAKRGPVTFAAVGPSHEVLDGLSLVGTAARGSEASRRGCSSLGSQSR